MTGPPDSGPAMASARSFLGTFALIFGAIAVLFVVDTLLAQWERAESRSEAARLYREGEQLLGQGRTLKAADRFRTALFIARDDRSYQIALAQALLAGGRLEDAEAALSGLLQHDATDGLANLVMARALVKDGRIPEATSYFHRAIYGQWREDPDRNRTQARLELIELLASQGSKKELLAELLPLRDTASTDLALRRRVGHLYITAGSPARAVEVFREILRRAPDDAEAYAGLGEAELARGNYRSAQADLQAAARLKPEVQDFRTRLELGNRILALDPTQRGLGGAEKFRRSVTVVELTLQSLDGCLPPTRSTYAQKALARARAVLGQRVPSSRIEAAMEGNLELAEELWQVRGRECGGTIPPEQEALALVQAKLAQ